MPKLAVKDEEIESCFAVMQELRPHLKEDEFLRVVRDMEQEGYKLAYKESDGRVVAVAGFRIYTSLFMGKNLYVDDLVTAAAERSRGYGEELLAWLRTVAYKNSCQYFHLDSGTHRHQAHKFYFRQGLTIASYHFSQCLFES